MKNIENPSGRFNDTKKNGNYFCIDCFEYKRYDRQTTATCFCTFCGMPMLSIGGSTIKVIPKNKLIKMGKEKVIAHLSKYYCAKDIKNYVYKK